jgi:predicted DNA-binding ribbon-helix-helix protein
MEQVSVSLEMAVWQSLHWPDGRRRMRLETEPIDERRCSVLQLVKALLDKYNDDHNLSEVRSFPSLLSSLLSHPAAYLGCAVF